MEDYAKVDLTNKVVLDVNEFLKLNEEIIKLKSEQKCEEIKYNNLLNYLFSECETAKYSSGEKFLKYDTYNNHLTDYLKEIAPEKYRKKLEESEKKIDEN